MPGLDAVLIGPHDLSCNLGIPEQYDHPRFDEAVREIFRIARSHNVGAGIHFWMGMEKEVAWSQAGGNLVMHSSDLATFSRTLKSEIETLRKSLGGGDGTPSSLHRRCRCNKPAACGGDSSNASHWLVEGRQARCLSLRRLWHDDTRDACRYGR